MKKRILVLEDDADILDILSYLLTEEGFEVNARSHGEGFRAEIKKFLPDLVLTDLMLADLDGRSICRDIKSNPETSHIPVIMITARPELGYSLNEPGAPDDFVTKPFDITRLIEKINKHLEK